MKKQLLLMAAVVALAGCATYHDDHDLDYRGAPPEDVDVIYHHHDAGDLRSPGGLDLPRGGEEGLPPMVTPPSGNRLRGLEPAPRYPTEAVPPY